MSFGSPSPPPPPDPVKTAQAQGAVNKEAAIASQELSMVNQHTPFGSLVYTPKGKTEAGTPQYTAIQTLSPDEQQKLDLTNQAALKFGETANTQLDAVRGKLSEPLDYGSLGVAPRANEETRQNVAESLYGRIEPLMDRDRDRLETRLATQGITLGSEAYKDAMDEERRARNDARLAIENQALGQMGQLYGLERSARDADINELAQQRQIPLNELSAMLSGTQVQGPSFVNAPQQKINPADLMGATYGSYQGQMNNYNQKMAQQNALMGGLFGLGGSLGGMGILKYSDRRLKKNIQRIGKLANGLFVYIYQYIWGGPMQIGVMADEVRQIMPQAVINTGIYDAVDYSKLKV